LKDEISYKLVCKAVAQYPGLSSTPSSSTALIPKNVEADLRKLETGYENKRPEDIAETIFKVTVLECKPKYEVVSQVLKLKR
jgi:hypothetical protein